MAFRPDQNNFGKGMWIDRFAPASTIIQVTQQGGSSSGSDQRNSFAESPDGVRKSFTLPSVPTAGNLKVYVGGLLYSSPDDYTLAGAVVTFVIAPAAGTNLVAYYGSGSSRQTATGAIDGINKIFVFSTPPSSLVLQLFVNGALQHEIDDYTLSGSTVTLNVAPAVNSNVVAYF